MGNHLLYVSRVVRCSRQLPHRSLGSVCRPTALRACVIMCVCVGGVRARVRACVRVLKNPERVLIVLFFF